MPRLLGRILPRDTGQSTPQLESIILAKFKDDDYINGRFIKAVKRYEYHRHKNSQQYAIFQRILLVVSALTPLIVGLDAIVFASNILKLLALILSVFVAILGNYLTTFNLQAKWGAYRSIRESLITEFYKFYMGVEPYSTTSDRTNDRRLFATKVEKLIEDANNSWDELHPAGSKSG